MKTVQFPFKMDPLFMLIRLSTALGKLQLTTFYSSFFIE